MHLDVKDIEDSFAKTVNMAEFIIQKHQTLFQDCLEMVEEVESAELERQTLERRSQLHIDELMSFEQEIKSLQESNRFFEDRIQELNRDIQDRDTRIRNLLEEQRAPQPPQPASREERQVE